MKNSQILLFMWLCNLWCSYCICSTTRNLYFYHCSRRGSWNRRGTGQAWRRRRPRRHRTRPHIREDRQTCALQMGCAPPCRSSVRRLGEHNRPDTKAQRLYSLVFQASEIICACFNWTVETHTCSTQRGIYQTKKLQPSVILNSEEQHLFITF